MIGTIIIGTTVICLFIASVHDIKTREVPDYLSYSLIALGVLYQSQKLLINGEYVETAITGILTAAATIFGYLMYRMKQWGGADTKLLIALALLLGGGGAIPLFLLFFTNFLWVGALYGLITTFIIIILHRKKFLKQVQEDYKKSKMTFWTALGISAGGLVPLLALGSTLLAGLVFLCGVLLLMSVLMKSANVLMIKRISVSKLTEGDWVIDRVKKNKKVLFDPKKDVAVTLKQISLMKKEGIKSIKIMEGVPFVPSFFIALLVTLINPYITLNIITGLVA